MSQSLDIGSFPLHGSRLIEASAGTGKTYTIALLYTRLILQHGDANAFSRALSPEEILVVTFTDAATQELKDRIRARLSDAARCFLSDDSDADQDLLAIRADYDKTLWPQCARLLSLAAQTMDQAAVSTIHGWCYRMLREHAFDSGSLFQQTLISNQKDILSDLMRDYWRQHFYALDTRSAKEIQTQFADPDALLRAVRPLINKTNTRLSYDGRDMPVITDLKAAIHPFAEQSARLETLENDARFCWSTAQTELEVLLDELRPALNLRSYAEAGNDTTFAALKQTLADWASGGDRPNRLERFAADQWKLKKTGKTQPDQPRHQALTKIAELLDEERQQADSSTPDLRSCILAHASRWLEQALQQRLQEKAELGFDDLLLQLDRALQGPQGTHLARQIRQDFPVTLIDEFQDTDPLQYRIFDCIYQLADNNSSSAIILIGDPKQAIYSFRNADIHTYLQARTATQGRHYNLATNYRASKAAVAAVNYVFAQAEHYEAGAFRFKNEQGNPLPFIEVRGHGRAETFVVAGQPASAVYLCYANNAHEPEAALANTRYRSQMAAYCAAEISHLLSDTQGGFERDNHLQPLRPRDIAILVRDRNEADEMRQALQQFSLASVYLSDRESVFQSAEAGDLLYWLSACAEPGDERKLRAALATVSLDLPLHELQRMLDDEFFWEQQTTLFRRLHVIWQTQGVLPMLRLLMQHYQLPQRLIGAGNGERRLTNLLHLAEYLQKASLQYDGEQTLIRHLAEQISDPGEEEILRLESDDDLIRVVTIHKSKGLEYPLVFLPFACSFREVNNKQHQVMIVDEHHAGRRRLEISGGNTDSAAWAQADQERMAEDLRLLYVALTRAQHSIWLGVASVGTGRSKSSSLHKSALGYLMGAGADLPPALTEQTLRRWADECEHIGYQPVADINRSWPATATTATDKTLHTKSALVSLRSPADNWWIASYSALKTGAIASSPDIARDDQTMEESIAVTIADATREPTKFSRQHSGLHGFHRGPGPGTFLHSLLEWATRQGFASAANNHSARLQEISTACELRGWQDDVERLDQWLSGFLVTDFSITPNTTVNLCELDTCQAELEFLFAVNHLETTALDHLCQQYLLTGQARPALNASQLNGMIKGFIDLVFQHNGQYYVTDWKSNYLGARDADYTPAVMTAELLHKRYDVQYAIYLLALHRLLGSRLDSYDYDQHIGGAVYFFLRGWQADSKGLIHDKPPKVFIEALDQLFLNKPLDKTPVADQVNHV
ncbi:MAG: exodeoxyribonuclease V subunit beta [Gammaproteobacteria bacterium]|nr:exodeoxyribonuclease V subunit beta [Gammaproteobacteria bacterium]